MAGSCVEGHRKRAKYLLGEAELGWSLASYTTTWAHLTIRSELLKKQKAGTGNSTSPPVQVQAPIPKMPSGMRNSTASFQVSPVCHRRRYRKGPLVQYVPQLGTFLLWF